MIKNEQLTNTSQDHHPTERGERGEYHTRILDNLSVSLDQTFFWNKMIEYWKAKGCLAFRCNGGEVTSDITNSTCHARVFINILKSVGFAGTTCCVGGQIVEYGAGTPYFADIVAWQNAKHDDQMFKDPTEWQWIVTDTDTNNLRDMIRTTRCSKNIKFAISNAEHPQLLHFLPNQEIHQGLQTRVVVANYLMGALDWQQYRYTDQPDGKRIYEQAAFQTYFSCSDRELKEHGFSSIDHCIKTYSSHDLHVLKTLDWRFYEDHCALVPVFYECNEQEISENVKDALALSNGQETVINTQAIHFLLSVLQDLPEDGIFFANDLLLNAHPGEHIKPLVLGGSCAIGLNIEHIKMILHKHGYFLEYRKASGQPYVLICISKKPNPELVQALEAGIVLEQDFTYETLMNVYASSSKNLTPSQQQEKIEKIKALIEKYGPTYHLRNEIAKLYDLLGNLQEALHYAQLAYAFAPQNQSIQDYIAGLRIRIYEEQWLSQFPKLTTD